jgi:hypothetical protein
MTTTTECTLRVGIGDLARAMTAVYGFADKSKPGDEQPMTVRIRLIAGRDHLQVCATDGRSAAMAWVEVLSDSRGKRFDADDGPFVVDLRPRHARAIANAITPNRVDGEDVGDASLAITVDTVTVTDVSGKYPETSHTVPVIEQEATMTLAGTDHLGYPDLTKTLASGMVAAAGTHKPFRPTPGILGRFEVAAREYGPLIFEPCGTAEALAWIVWARDGGFVAQIETRHQDDSERRRELSRRMLHLERLGVMSASERAAAELAAGPVPEPLDDPEVDEREDDEDDVVEAELTDDVDGVERKPGEDEDGFYDPDRDPTAPAFLAAVPDDVEG